MEASKCDCEDEHGLLTILLHSESSRREYVATFGNDDNTLASEPMGGRLQK